METDEPTNLAQFPEERLLKKKEIKRDPEGRFEQHGAGLIKKAQKKPEQGLTTHLYQPGHNRPGPGRPKGSVNKTTANLKAMILGALDKVGGEAYLQTLAVENSSAFAGLLGKVLPAVLAAEVDSSGGAELKMTFTRRIVYPNGHVEGDGIPKQLPSPASHALPNSDTPGMKTKVFKDLDE